MESKGTINKNTLEEIFKDSAYWIIVSGNFIFIFDTGGREERPPTSESRSGIFLNLRQYVSFLLMTFVPWTHKENL